MPFSLLKQIPVILLQTQTVDAVQEGCGMCDPYLLWFALFWEASHYNDLGNYSCSKYSRAWGYWAWGDKARPMRVNINWKGLILPYLIKALLYQLMVFINFIYPHGTLNLVVVDINCIFNQSQQSIHTRHCSPWGLVNTLSVTNVSSEERILCLWLLGGKACFKWGSKPNITKFEN